MFSASIPKHLEWLGTKHKPFFLTIPNGSARMRVMAAKSKGISPSFPLDEHPAILARVRALRLPERGGLSQYFQMLWDYDQHVKLVPHYHQSDGKLHFYPEKGIEYSHAAETQTADDVSTDLARIETASLEEELQKRKHPTGAGAA